VGFKEIMMKLGEMPSELDRRLKCKIHKANMNLTNGQHREWFVALLLPHLRVALSQKEDYNSGRGLGDCNETT